MATLEQQSNPKPQKKRARKNSIHMDMTPMVDLAFLLLTFFVLTATFQLPKTMELSFPTEGPSSPVKKGITFLLGEGDRIFYYEGEMTTGNIKGGPGTKLKELSYSPGIGGLHAFLLEKNAALHEQLRDLVIRRNKGEIDEHAFKKLSVEKKASKEQYTYIIKTGSEATYKNVVDVVDELNINMVGKYVVADIHPFEIKLMDEFYQVANLK